MAKKGKHTHLLVLRLSAMGDVAMLVPVFSALFRNYPTLRVTLLTKTHFAPIFSDFDNVEVFPAEVKGKHKGIFGLYKLFKELRKAKFDAVADTHNVLRSNILKFMFKASGIPVVQMDKGRKAKKALTRAKNKRFAPLKSTHERYADVFSSLGYALDLQQSVPLKQRPLSAELQELLGNTSKNWIGIAPFAAHEGKMYPLDLMEKVVRKLVAKENNAVMLFGGGQEEEKILNGMVSKIEGNVIAIAGKLSFASELIVLSNLDVMVSMDSGNGHLAANYGIPVITLWGVTHPYAGFAPYGQKESYRILADRQRYPLIPTSVYGNTFPEGYENAMRTIAPEAVVAKIMPLLKS